MSSCYNQSVIVACGTHESVYIYLQCIEVIAHDSKSAHVSLRGTRGLVGLVASCYVFGEASTKSGILASSLIFSPLCLILDGFISRTCASWGIIFRGLISLGTTSWCWLIFHHLIDFWVYEVHLLSWISVWEVLANINLRAFLNQLGKTLRAVCWCILLFSGSSTIALPALSTSTWASLCSTALRQLRNQPATFSWRPSTSPTATRRNYYLCFIRNNCHWLAILSIVLNSSFLQPMPQSCANLTPP